MNERLDKDIVLTEQGRRKLETELEYLRTVRRLEVANRIREALEFGDAWENPEYEAAKTEQAFVEGRIKTLDDTLRNARVIAEASACSDIVALGARVRVRDLESLDEFEYLIVGSAEADPVRGRISNKSPVAQALLGHKVGDRVKAQAPVGTFEYEVLTIGVGESTVSTGETA